MSGTTSTTRRSIPMRILRDLDIGLPVVAGGTEYVLLDKIYMRTPCYSKDSLVGYRLLGFDLPLGEMLTKLCQEVTDEELLMMAFRHVIQPNIDQNHSTIEMIADARNLADELRALQGPLSLAARAGVETLDGDLVVSQTQASTLSALRYQPMSDLASPNTPVGSFDIYTAVLYRVPSGKKEHGLLRLGTAFRNNGFQPNEHLTALLTRDAKTQNRLAQTQPDSGPSPL